MDQQRDIDLIDNLRKQPAETPWLEFKANYHEPEKIGQLVSALSNGARIEDNAAQASAVIRQAMDRGLIKYKDANSPRAGYYPIWGMSS